MQCNNMALCIGNISVQPLEGIRQHSRIATSPAHIRMEKDRIFKLIIHRITETGLADKFHWCGLKSTRPADLQSQWWIHLTQQFAASKETYLLFPGAVEAVMASASADSSCWHVHRGPWQRWKAGRAESASPGLSLKSSNVGCHCDG
jgi:hypothetical protein